MALDKREILTKQEVKKALCRNVAFEIYRQLIFAALFAVICVLFPLSGFLVLEIYYWGVLSFYGIYLVNLLIRYFMIRSLRFSFAEDTFVSISENSFKAWIHYYFAYQFYILFFLGKLKLVSFASYGTTDRLKSSISVASYGDPYIVVLLNNRRKSVIDYYSATLYRLDKTNS